MDGAYWSLTVEVQFYVIAAFFWAVLRSKFWVGLLVLSAIHAAWPHHSFALLLMNLPLFLVGIGLCMWFFEQRYTEAAFVVLSSAAIFTFVHISLPLSYHAIVWISIYALVLGVRFFPTISLGPVAALGEMSYAMYLIHQRVGVILIRWLSEHLVIPDVAKIIIAILLMYAVAALVTIYIERPSRRFINGLRGSLAGSFGYPRVRTDPALSAHTPNASTGIGATRHPTQSSAP